MATFTGTAGADSFVGAADVADVFNFLPVNLSSADVLVGGEGAVVDRLRFTGAGTVLTSAFADVAGIERIQLFSGGNDVTLTNALVGSALNGFLQVVGGAGNDVVDAGNVVTATSRVQFNTGAGADELTGGVGNDTFLFRAINFGSDTVTGNGGADTLRFTTAGTVDAAAFAGTSGIESVVLANGANTITLTDAMAGSASGQLIKVTGGTGNDSVNAIALTGANRVTFVAGAGDDSLIGGAGKDNFQFQAANFTGADVVQGNGGADVLRFTTAGTFDAAAFAGTTGIESIVLANGANSITIPNALVGSASGQRVTVIGGAGDDTVSTTGGFSAGNRVVIIAGAGDDSLSGSSRDDVFRFEAINLTNQDTVQGGAGSDVLQFTTAGVVSASAFAFVTGIESIVLADGANNITLNLKLVVSNGTFTVTGDSGGDSVNAGDFIGDRKANLIGGDGADDFIGGHSTDTLSGGAGADVLRGYLGADVLIGGSGGDTFRYSTSTEFIVGESIDGTAEAATDDVIRLDAGGLYDFAVVSVQNVDVVAVGRATAAGVEITLSNAMLATADGNNSGIAGDLDISSLVSTTHGIVVDASAVTDGAINVRGANLRGADSITGGEGDDAIFGGAGADTIDAGDGSNSLTGGTGADDLSGGVDDDDFIYNVLADSNEVDGLDVISAFDEADRLNFSRLEFTTRTDSIILKADGAYVGSTAGFFDDAGNDFAVAVQTNGTSTRVYADIDGDGDYVVGKDLVVQFTGDLSADLKSTDAYIFA